MFAAVQQFHGTIMVFPVPKPVADPVGPRRLLLPVGRPDAALGPATALTTTACMSTAPKPREFFIQGITKDGRTFRPSDWSERLAGALSSFRPPAGQLGGGIGAHIGYSPYCVPRVVGGIKCVIVNEALRDLEPMAWDFVMHFARDNELQVSEACLVPEPPQRR